MFGDSASMEELFKNIYNTSRQSHLSMNKGFWIIKSILKRFKEINLYSEDISHLYFLLNNNKKGLLVSKMGTFTIYQFHSPF